MDSLKQLLRMEGGSEMSRETVKEALKASAGHSVEVLLQETGLFFVCGGGGEKTEEWGLREKQTGRRTMVFQHR